ncbi:serine hydrolase domain-containing protein [Cellulomonas chengniuliangii]|uniref:serine hydrolase domain-containing protein n=1 Tax=Cellulomonas chengniuliangii TaxID=2968084 RepID=UPI001D0E0712|nr:serine hydrolase domain-containing protein [Cellulomonas chengniuliangii]MCC2317896.1 beta-lactamase family protein [Cellulomonas chengniuliangii]
MTKGRALAVVGALAAGALLASPGVAVAGGGPGHGGPGHGKPRVDRTQQALDRLVGEDGFPAALAAVTDARGRERNLVAGVGDLETGGPVPVDGQVRIASTSKSYTAVVVLQLVAEGAVDLDEPIETYLPGLVRGADFDGHGITVRQLLNHTSGLPEYTNRLGGAFEARTWYLSARDLLDLALAQPRQFPAGETWGYSNTNYVLAGLLIEKVTHRPLEEAITQRIIEPLGLTETYVPNRGEIEIRGEHPRGYDAEVMFSGDLADITDIDSSLGWAAGEIVATPSDVNRFYTALLDGKLLPPAELEAMTTTLALPEGAFIPGVEYGLGLMKFPLSCGGEAWGHGGSIQGYGTRSAATEDGRAASVAVTALPQALRGDEASATAAAQHVLEAMDTALCS